MFYTDRIYACIYDVKYKLFKYMCLPMYIYLYVYICVYGIGKMM